jgi:hypothetical protein
MTGRKETALIFASGKMVVTGAKAKTTHEATFCMISLSQTCLSLFSLVRSLSTGLLYHTSRRINPRNPLGLLFLALPPTVFLHYQISHFLDLHHYPSHIHQEKHYFFL